MNRRRLFTGIAIAGALAAGAAFAGSISALNYNTPGGAVTEIGGVLEVMSGGTFRLDTGAKTAAATAGAATLNKLSGVVTSESLTTAPGAAYTLTLANSRVAVGDEVFASVSNGTNSGGSLGVRGVTAGNGTLTVIVGNGSGGTALNGTIAVTFMVLKN